MFLSNRNYTGSCGLVKSYINIISRFDSDIFFVKFTIHVKLLSDATSCLKGSDAFLRIFTNWRL